MAVQTAQPVGAAPVPAPLAFTIEPRSFGLLFSCIPFIGHLWSSCEQHCLNKNIAQVREPKVLIEIIHLKNQYKIASAIGFLILAVSKVAQMSLGFLSLHLIPLTVLRGICVALAVRELYHVYSNQEMINELQVRGCDDVILIK